MASLKFDSGPRTGEKVPLDKAKVTFGRGKSCDCIIAHPTVSREHFYLEHNNGKYFLVDQGSENGTRANGERISWIELKDGDEIKAGPFTLVFEMDKARTETVELPIIDQTPKHCGRIKRGRKRSTSPLRMYAPQYLAGIEHFSGPLL